MRILFLVISICFLHVVAIYEDQVGKFDWRKPLVGCPTNVVFDSSDSNVERLLVSTDQSVVAALERNSGKIVWRRILENSVTNSPDSSFTIVKENMYAMTNDGRSVRVWRKSNGVLIQQFPVSDDVSERHIVRAVGHTLIVSTGKKLLSLSIEHGKPLETILSTKEKAMTSFVSFGSSLLYVSMDSGSTNIDIVRVGENGKFEEGSQISFVAYDASRCHTHHSHITCFNGRVVTTANVITSNVMSYEVDFDINSVFGFKELVVVRGKSRLAILERSVEKFVQKHFLSVDESEKFGFIGEEQVLVIVSKENIRVVSMKNGSEIVMSPLPPAVRAPPKFVFARMTAKSTSEYEIVIVGHDCRVEMVVVDASGRPNLEWAREESLISVESVEMVDLPLSESQQMIEDEFEEEESNVFSAFGRRVSVQFGQLYRFFTRNLEKAISIGAAFSQKSNGLSDFIDTIRLASSAADMNALFERDYFNLRKVIIVTSTHGTIFGIDSDGGTILWKIWLGNSFSPLKSDFSARRVPLFVQRTTAYYQLHGLASVAFSDKITGNGVLVSFNPIIGELVLREDLPYPIKRITLLPVTDHKHIHPIITIGAKNEMDITPTITPDELDACRSLYIMDIDRSSNTAYGLEVNLADRNIDVVWSGNIGLQINDKVISVKGKPYTQKVHSQGRVLMTRDVQYKYVNPNLVAVASMDVTKQHLSIVLVDIVTGQVIHSASVGKAAEPIHLVHSENWIAYSYWSEKGRRTELGVIELYEGSEEQPQKVLFDSKQLPKEPPTVLTQSYIYAQGVDAMSISETEQGLTTRSILLALPSGNIHEVSRRLLDATRPLDVTQAMREELIIGYMPEIAVGMEEMINYNQTIHRVRGIKTSPSGLESTSLVFAYGTDIFFTRLVPSGTFDILKDDFDHVLITIVLTGLILGSYMTKRWARSNALSAQWS